MVSYGEGFCDEGYYAGWDGKGVNSQEECNLVCSEEPECTYAAFFGNGANSWPKPGPNSCSRYKGTSCNLFCDYFKYCNQFVFDNSKTFKKTTGTVAS